MTALASGGEPLSMDDLIRPMGTGIFRAVEPLQVAAMLESQGLNDKIAREKYGHDDVFSLAEAAYTHISTMTAPRPPAGTVLRRARPLAQMLHGLLYGLPAALLPAASGLVGTQWLMPGLVLTTGIGWVLGSAAAQTAYSLAGRGFPRSAGRTLRTGLLLGVLAAMLMAGVIALVRNGPVALVALCVMQMAFQLASGILLFYRREIWLGVIMMPAVVAGIAYMGIGDSWVGLLAVCVGVVCIAGIVGAALLLTLAAGAHDAHDDHDALAAEPPLRTLVRPDVRALLPSLLYATLTAVFLLQAEARYVLDRTDIAVAGAGLVLGMGVLEYRAHTFEDETRAAIREVVYPVDFTRRSRWLLAKGMLICLGTLATLTALPLAFLHFTHTLTEASVAMAAAHVTVGGAYFLAFLLANQAKVVHLCLAQGAALAVHPLGRFVLPDHSALADVLLFLAAALLFFLVLLTLMSRSLRDVKQYR
ncbi:hypothetical protein SAMN05444920_10483 [Nonomuraea solani]|uniref:Uncharacterized protein n=1 Tax=Nonomuraea solani TaxID=1144553 RepID=A0A1H6CKC7_9ACTN|nr:hypothetical protein [Nonomuraea solani]SEG73461.1 hypothetical protein SAMN05444920_10483 [Nonomuraea solani]